MGSASGNYTNYLTLQKVRFVVSRTMTLHTRLMTTLQNFLLTRSILMSPTSLSRASCPRSVALQQPANHLRTIRRLRMRFVQVATWQSPKPEFAMHARSCHWLGDRLYDIWLWHIYTLSVIGFSPYICPSKCRFFM